MAETSGAGAVQGRGAVSGAVPPGQRETADEFAGSDRLTDSETLLEGADIAETDDSQFTVLERQTCFNLMASRDIGRVAFTIEGDAAPTVLPVNYALVHDTIVFRSTLSGTIMRFAQGYAAFQVDLFDEERREGWSVLASGRCRWVQDSGELARVPQGRLPKPWAEGDRNQVLKITPGRVSGRRIASS